MRRSYSGARPFFEHEEGTHSAMIGRWVRRVVWRPYELTCRRFPLVPFRASVETPCDGVRILRIGNIATRAIAALGGGYDYSVSYVVGDAVLIDTGFPWARRSLAKTLLELGLTRSLAAAVNTHAHEDHTGNNDLIAETTPATVYAHPLAVSKIRHPVELPWYRNFMFGPPSAADVKEAPTELELGGRTLEIHHLPGHSPDHICVFEPEERWLFSGDLFISADIDTQLREVDGPTWIASLERAVELKARWLFDGHGTVVEGEDRVHALLARKRDFLKALEERIRSVARDARPIPEITREVFANRGIADTLSFQDGWLSLLTCSDFSRGHLVESFLRARA